MDDLDEKILRALATDGRISNLALSDRVGLSPSACLRRVAALEKRGIITGYRARLDPAKRGAGFIAFLMVGLSLHTRAAQEGFETAMARAREVVECHNITGSVEYLLRIEAADLASFKHFHTDVLGTQAHVASITTHVVMGSPKDLRA